MLQRPIFEQVQEWEKLQPHLRGQWSLSGCSGSPWKAAQLSVCTTEDHNTGPTLCLRNFKILLGNAQCGTLPFWLLALLISARPPGSLKSMSWFSAQANGLSALDGPASWSVNIKPVLAKGFIIQKWQAWFKQHGALSFTSWTSFVTLQGQAKQVSAVWIVLGKHVCFLDSDFYCFLYRHMMQVHSKCVQWDHWQKM